MFFYPSRINKSDYSYIYRKNTQTYTLNDISAEIEEWTDIISKITDQKPAIIVREVKINSRLTRTLARTYNYGCIEVNEAYLRHHSDPSNFHGTLCHEVIHTFPGCFDHKENFKTLGEYIGYLNLGVRITRTSCDAGYYNYKPAHSRKEEDFRYKAVCKECGQVVKYRRGNAALIKNPRRFKCGICGGQFKIYELLPNGIESEIIKIAI